MQGSFFKYRVEHEQCVLSGKAAAQISDKEIKAKVGDVLMIFAVVPHEYNTIGNEAHSFLCLVPSKKDNKMRMSSC